jgi:microcystin-dependent protein
MAINFPNSPSDGDIFGNYTYDNNIPGWRKTPENAASLPAGTIVQWPGASAPANWLICDGAAISRTEYASLFAAIGVQYGAGNGTTTFNLPNLKGRVAVGFDASQSEFDTLGEVGGAKTHTLTTAQMPSHTHTQNAHNHTQNPHTHSLRRGNAGTARIEEIGYSSGGNPQTTNAGVFSTTATNNETIATNQNTGGGEAHNNLQPYIVLNYIIKTSAGITSGDSELATRVGATESVDTTQNSRLTDLETVTTPVAASSRRTNGVVLPTTYTTYLTVTVTATGRPVLVNLSGTYSNGNSGSNRFLDFRLQMDGVTVGDELVGLFSPLHSGSSSPLTAADSFLVTPSVGSRTFTFQARAANASSVVLVRASLVVTQL